jgi:protein involved in polysaccharide export with SLBB domain
VVGAVVRPGEVTIPRRTTVTLLDALAIAGGLTPDADRSRIVLIRDNLRSSYSMEQLDQRGDAAVTVEAGDRIHVATSRFAGQSVTVVGEVQRPGPVPFPIRGQLDLGTLLDSVGGVSAKADPSRILVRRGTHHYVADLAVAGRHPLAPGDVISVPPSAFVGKTVTVIGKVTRPGPVEFPASGAMSALEAVAGAGGFADLANPRKVYLTRAGRKMKLNLKDAAEGKSPKTPLQPGDTIFVEVRLF